MSSSPPSGPRPTPTARPPGSSAAGAGGGGRAARIWRRTWVGLLLTAAVSAILGATWHPAGGALVLAVGSLAMVGCCVEMGRLGRFAGRGLERPLLAAGAVLVAALARDLQAGQPELSLVWRYLETASLALLVGALVAWSGPSRSSLATVLALFVVLAAGAWHLWRPIGVDPRWGALLAAALAALACLASLADAPRRRHLVLLGALALWLVPPLPGLLHIWLLHGAAGLTALVILSKIGDVFGYYVGNAMGRSHPFPRISPGKTTAGCVGSLLGAVAVGGGLVWLGLLPSGPLGLAGGLLSGLTVNLAAQAGDLIESRVKRAAAVKDSGNWFGPAGGLLDVFDSLLLSAPVALLTWPWILGVY